MHSPNVRESRHVLVTGLSDTTTAQEIDNFFSNFGKLEKEAVRCPDGVIISFRDIRSAQKALQSDQRLKNLNYQMSYHEANTAAKNSTSNSCMDKRSSASPQAQDQPPRRPRSISPWREKFDQWQLEKNLKSRTKRPLNNSIINRNQRRDGRSPPSPSTAPPEGLQGYYIENLPRKVDPHVLKRDLTEQFKTNGSIADITLEDINGNYWRALVLFNEVKFTPEKYEMFGTTRCRVRPAEPVDVQIAYSKTVARKAGIAISAARERDLPSNLQEEFTVFSDRASRTLYVGGLETNPTEQSLRRRFDRFGTILEIDVKNPESPTPFAFIHYVDLESTVKAVNHHLQHGASTSTTFGKKQTRVNFGRTPVSNKLWLGCIPSTVPEDIVKSKLKSMFDGSTDVLYDKSSHQALVRFDSAENTQKGHTGIRSQNIEFEYDGQVYRLSVDYGTEALLNYFRDRLGKSNYLSPPPNPPTDMPGYSRYDDRKSSSRRRSRSRDRRRSRSGSRRRNRRRSARRRTRSSSEDSSMSSGPSSSNSSRSPSPSRGDSPRLPSRYRQSSSKKRNDDHYHSSEMDRSPKRSYSRERRKSVASLPKHSDSHSHHHQQPPGTSNGDSGYEERSQLEPPPAPPPLVPPLSIHRGSPPPAPPAGPPPPLPKQPPPPQFFHHVPSGHQSIPQPQPPPRPQPPPLMAQPVAPPPMLNLSAAMKPHRPRPEEQHHIPYPGPSNERDHSKQRPPEKREERKESIIRHPEHHGEKPREDKPRPPGQPMPDNRRPPHEHERRPPHEQRPGHDQLVKKPSVDAGNTLPPLKHIPKNQRELGLKDPRIHRRPDCPPRPILGQIGHFQCIYGTWEIRSQPVMEARKIKEPSSNPEQREVYPEARKRSSGSVHSVDHNKGDNRNDARRASGGGAVRIDSHDDSHNPLHLYGQPPTSAPAPPTPAQPLPPTTLFNIDETARLKQRSESAPTWQNQKSLEPQTPQTPAPFSAGPGPAPSPGLIQSRTGSISYEDRLSKLRQLGTTTKHTPIKLGGFTPLSAQTFATAMSGGNLPPPPLPSSSTRPNLHIQIPAAATSFPTTPNSAKSDFSPRVDNVRKLNTAIPTSSTRQPFPPASTSQPSSAFEQHPSPLLNAPPPPPVLPKLDAYLKSPPVTPSASRQQQAVSTPSPSIPGRPTDFKQQTPQTPNTPRSAYPPGSRPSMERRDSERRAEFGAVNPWDKNKEKVQPQPVTQRHDSLSFMRSPPVPPKKTSLPAPQETASAVNVPPPWAGNVKPREQPKETVPQPFGRIPKKPTAIPAPVPASSLIPPKTKEHKKHKEHKLRMKSDGTYETREERKIRKAMQKANKEREKKMLKKLEKKKSKERDSKEKEKEKKKEKEHKKDKKEKEKKKKKKKHRESSDDDTDVDGHFQKQVMKDQSELSADAQLASMIGGPDMYDRVKRRTSGVAKDDQKKKALQALKNKHPKKKRLLLSSSEDEADSSAESDAKKSDSEPEADDEQQKKPKTSSLQDDLALSSESDSEPEVKPKKAKIEKQSSSFLSNDDVYGADSSEDELVKPPIARKPKTSVSDESDHHKKSKLPDYHSLFGSDSLDEKKEKKKSQSPAQQKQRKRLPSTHEESQAKRSKRGSLSSEVSGEAKSREQSVKKEDEHPTTSGSEDKHPIHQETEKPRLLTKAAMKVFETPSTSHQQLQLSDANDTDDSDEAGPAESQNLSSTSGSDSEASGSMPLSPRTVHEEELHDDGQSTVATTEPNEQSQEAPLDVLPAPPAPPSHFPPQTAEVQYEFQEIVEEEPVRDLEGDLAAQAICDDDQNYEVVAGQPTIFDDCVDPIPEYPSHAFTRMEEPIIVDPNPVDISEEQILMESFAEEPIPEEEEEPLPPPSDHRRPSQLLQPPTPLQTSTPHPNQENEFPSPTTLAAHAVAVKSPLSVAVDGPQPPAPIRTPHLFSPVATSSSNDGLISPIRSNHTPMSAVAQSPLVSPGMATATPPLRMDMMRNADFTQNLMAHQNVYHTGQQQQFANSFYPNNIRSTMAQQMPHQQVPLQQMAPVHQSSGPVPHLNGLASSSVTLEQHRGLAAVPSPSHQHSGNSSLSSPGTPPSFGKKMPPVWKGRIIIKNAAEATVQMHYMFGEKEYLNKAMATLDKLEKDPSLRIGQRMKAEGDGLYRLLHRLQELGTTCLCVPVGNNQEEVQQHARTLKTEFADYFIRRGCAGVIPLEISPKSFLYVFPPNEFTDQFLQSASPDLFSRIQNKLTEQFSYLFVAIAPATED